jgi:hypothetical protein
VRAARRRRLGAARGKAEAAGHGGSWAWRRLRAARRRRLGEEAAGRGGGCARQGEGGWDLRAARPAQQDRPAPAPPR